MRVPAALCLILACTLWTSSARSQENFYVQDTAGVINAPTRTAVTALLSELEQKTGAQFVVLTVKTTGGVPIEQFSLEKAQSMRLGRKDVDDGLLLLIAVEDRKYRFETGYGLEQVLPDSLLGSVGRRYLVPSFKRGDYSQGILDAARVISATIARSRGVKITGMEEPTQAKKRAGFPVAPLLTFFAIAVILAALSGPHRRGGIADALVIGSILRGAGHRGTGGGASGGW